ncbi:ABC transporter permease [Fulvivirgaceae bacterium BMA12]|uniref:ABC transporter permease n=1 Tax=Agaribacillus aureus TaxID=3051825 RepID=A0ABT8L0S5_9BACT|nr:ABC transporter permease [Fulvivirgaceae bacterium BMA12]
MWLNYLKIALRNTWKYRTFSLVNIIGLSVGMATFYVIFSYVQYELGYDNFHKAYDQLYRVNLVTKKDGEVITKDSRTPPAVGKLMKNEIPGVIDFTRVVIFGEGIISCKEKSIREKNILLTDPEHFDVLSYEMIHGAGRESLREPMSVVISASMANLLFGAGDPINQFININSGNLDGSSDFVVRGVFKDQEAQSHLRPNILISYATVHKFLNKQIDDSWDWNNLYTYVRITKGASASHIKKQLQLLAQERIGEKLDGMQVEWEFILQPVADIYIESGYQYEFASGGNKKIVYLLSVIAFFILLIAYVNFINLATSQSTRRSREVGIRKVNGARQMQLIPQFMCEALITNVFSFLVAFTLVQSLYAGLATYFQLPTMQGAILQHWPYFGAFVLFSTLISGIYPAMVLSSFKPTSMIKGTENLKIKGILLKKILVVIQFTISLILILGTLTIYLQLQFIRDFDLGLNLHNQLIVKSPRLNLDNHAARSDTFKKKLLDLSFVEKVASLNEIPGNEIYWRSATFESNNGNILNNPSILPVDDNYFKVFDINLLVGRTFKRKTDTYENAVIINKRAAEVLGFTSPGNAIGHSVVTEGMTSEIVGVVDNYYQESLKKTIQPVVFRYSSSMLNYFAINISDTKTGNIIKEVEATFKNMFPDSPFEYFFLDEFYQKQYIPDVLFGKLFNFFALLAILVASLGIFALSLINVLQRTKEIGIRKVLGASVTSILGLLSKEYFLLIFMATIIGLPIAYWSMKLWLINFVVHVELSWWLFVIPPLIMGVVIVITIAYNSIKAALTDPVKSIRYE